MPVFLFVFLLQIDQTGQIIANLCNVIPDGVVCFFASYPYMELVCQRWSQAESGKILDRISKKKKVSHLGIIENCL